MNNIINRRSFLKHSALGSAGIFLGGSLLNARDMFAAARSALKSGVGGLVPVSIIEDANILVSRTAEFNGDSEFALTSDLHTRPAAPGNKGRLASILPVQDKKLMELLDLIRQKKDLKNRVEKIAIANGWICNNATFKYLKPVYGNDPSPEKIMDIQAYHDAQLLIELSGMQVTSGVKEEYLAALFNEMLPRTLTRVHTLIPAEDGHDWVNRMTDWRVANKTYLDTLAQIMVNPELSKKQDYVDGPNFYGSSDALLVYCRNLQHAKNVKTDKIEMALNEASNGSLYAKALSESVKNIMAANEFVNGNLSGSELENRLF
ncbi:MAG: twin-arginine translocation signal domain-containing protein [Bacteroidota bacterium]